MMGTMSAMLVARRIACVGAVASLICGQAVWGQDSDQKSGRVWLRKCTSPEPYGQIECANYIRALVEYDEVREELGEKQFICAKKGVTVGQSRDAVVKSLRDHPQDLHRSFALLAHLALKSEFPCETRP